MTIHFSQFYVDPQAWFPFSYRLHHVLASEFNSKIKDFKLFEKRFGFDGDLMFRINASDKNDIAEVYGPTIFKRERDVEYTLVLPYREICKREKPLESAVFEIISLACAILEGIGMGVDLIRNSATRRAKEISEDNEMYQSNDS